MRRPKVPAVVVLAVVAASCAWPTARFDRQRTGHNPGEITIGVDEVADLETSFTGVLGSATDVWAAPVVVADRVYVAHTDGWLYVFSSVGTTGCTGTPAACEPLWKAPIGSPAATPTVDGGVVYAGSPAGGLAAFDARGQQNCSGTPRICSPLWTAPAGGGEISSPLVAEGTVYVGAGGHLHAFDAAGEEGCSGSPVTCEPRWSAVTGTWEFSLTTAPAIADGVVYTTADLNLFAFDAAGVTNCSGTPTTCEPLWTASPTCSGIISCIFSSPAVADGIVYVSSEESDEFAGGGGLYAFEADGGDDCDDPVTGCQPRWEARTRGSHYTAPAVADGVVYTTDYWLKESTFESEARLVAYDATDGGCDASGCTPLWTATLRAAATADPAVANGLVFVADTSRRVAAYDADGVVGCAGAPVACEPLWSYDDLVGFADSAPTVVLGRLYIGERGALRVFGLPQAVP